MDPVAFLGTYKALPSLGELGMPAITEDTLWQVWEHANGNHWVGPLSYEDPQHVGGYTVAKNIVDEGFIRISEDPGKDGFLCSHDPNLVLEWYSQVTTLAKGRENSSLTKESIGVAEEALSEEELIAQLTKYVQEQSHNATTTAAVEVVDAKQVNTQAFEPQETFDKTLEQLLEQESLNIAEHTQKENVQKENPQRKSAPAENVKDESASTENIQKNLAHTDLAFLLDGAPAQLGEKAIDTNRDGTPPKYLAYASKVALTAEESERLEETARKQFVFLMQLWDNQPGNYVEAQIQTFLKDPCPYREEAKFLFSDFGVQLRRRGLYSLALTCHGYALLCSPSDENILFNVARAEYELGNTDATKKYLQKALEIAPDFAVAKNFYNFLSAKQ